MWFSMLIAMKKATLFALKEDRDAILLALQKDGNIMLISEGDKAQALEGADKVGDRIAKAEAHAKVKAKDLVAERARADRAVAAAAEEKLPDAVAYIVERVVV